MGVIAAFFTHLLRMCPDRLFTGLLLIRGCIRVLLRHPYAGFLSFAPGGPC
jgi:hypothetical protein